jgi:hypothetical protein
VEFLSRMLRIAQVVLLGYCSIVWSAVCAAEPESSPVARTNISASFSPDKAPLQEISPGIYKLGKVRLDKNQKTITFPAVLNMNEALVEYLVVSTNGKTHESLLRTDAEPWHIHVAMLLLGAKGSQDKSFPENKTQPLPGDTVRIEIRWMDKENPKRFRGEDWIIDVAAKQAVSPGYWTYTGSRIEDGNFRAQQDGSIIALIEDADALINNPRTGRDNDDNWRVKSEGLPPLETPAEVTIYWSK